MFVEFILLLVLVGLLYKWYQTPQGHQIPPNGRVSKEARPLPQPPGGHWYFGHFLQLGELPHRTFTKWSKSLGDIYMIRMGKLNAVVLNSDKVVYDLITKRGALYSSRQPSYFIDMATRGFALGFIRYTPRFKQIQTIFHKALSTRKIESYSKVIDESVTDFVKNLYRANERNSNGIEPRVYYRQASMNIVLTVGFGQKTKDIDDPLFKKLNEYVDYTFEYFSVPNLLGDYFPILTYNPFSKTKKQSIAYRDYTDKLMGQLLENVKNDKERKPSFTRELWENREEENLNELEILHVVSVFITGGTDTITTSLHWLTAFLANEQHVQQELHEELDRVVGHSRLPVASDESSLPLVHSLIREGQRMYAPSWIGIPHFIEEDDEYEGYHIPANSMVILNSHAIHYDQRKYPNPDVFDVRRFLPENEYKKSFDKREHYSFGGGRRLCPGIHLAEAELFLFMARLLWCYRIENASPLDSNGLPTPIDLTKEINAMTVSPHPYLVKFVPRHEGVAKVLFPRNN